MSDQHSSARRALLVAGLGTMLALICFTVPLSTLNATASGLGADVAGSTWILSSMSIGLAAALLTSGTVADDFGRRRAFVAGMAVLALGSVVCALAPHVFVFVLARIVQGVGSAAVVASSLGIIAHAFPTGPQRAAAGGAWGASVGAGIAIGPIISAGLDRYADWRDAYWVVAAAAVILAVAAHVMVGESRSPQPRGLDLWGAILLAAGMSSFLAALVEGRQGWTDPRVLVLFAAAFVLFTAFLIVQSRNASAMLDLALFAHRPFAAATIAAFATGMGVIGLFSYMCGFLGAGLGISALGASFLLFSWSATSVVTALLARRIPARFPGRVQLGIGMLGVALGQIALYGATEASTWRRFVPGLVIAGVASGFVNAALGREAVASVPAERGGMGSGANNTARYVGSAIGVTIVAVIASRAGAGSPIEDLIAGWNVAVIVTTVFTVFGALIVLACRPRKAAVPAPSENVIVHG